MEDERIFERMFEGMFEGMFHLTPRFGLVQFPAIAVMIWFPVAQG
jgi:hypothetical protein